VGGAAAPDGAAAGAVPVEPGLAASAFARTDYAAQFDAVRPRPPAVLLDVLCRYARVARPRLVVDLGCGTGLSTAVWAARAERVVGVEPAPGMLAVARRRPPAANVAFRAGPGHATGLPPGGADVVTAVQAFHYMEPEATLAEAARLLRPGGVFAAADYYGPVTSDWELEAADERLYRTAPRLRAELASPYVRPRRWPKEGHLESLRRSGRFRFVKEVLLHSEEGGGAERYVRHALNYSVEDLDELRARGVTDEQLGLADLRRIAERVLGPDGRWVLSWRVRVGVRA
jgi:SAM-dependent methyltransferase